MTTRAFVGRPSAGPREAADWSRRRILANDLRSVVGRAFPRVRGMVREPSWLFFEILLPFLTTCSFVFVYRALQAPQQYIGFVVLGGAMTAFWLNVVWMMAAQLYWEKDQGNLELYFAAPMDMMSVLFGMAIGGLVMSATRAAVVLVVASLVFHVQFSVDQWGLLLLVFFLTLAALYGLGMVLASLFLMWGREAWHLTQLMVEPVYFVSGLNFPIVALGRLGALALATIPLATGLDAMRQLAFAGSSGTPAILPPEAEAAILVLMTVVLHPARPVHAPHPRGAGPARGPAHGALAMTAPAAVLDEASRRLFDPRRTRGRGSADLVRSFRTAAALGWKMEANWTDPVLFFIYSVAKPVSSALILVAMLEVIAGASGREYRGFVVVGSALWSFVISGIAGLAWSVLDDRERYRMLKYVYVSPSDFLVVLLGRGTARIAVGAMGAAITLAIGVVLLGVPFDPAAVDWPLLVVVMAPGLESIVVDRGDPRRGLPPDPPGGVVATRRPSPAPCSSSRVPSSRCRCCRWRSRRSACSTR